MLPHLSSDWHMLYQLYTTPAACANALHKVGIAQDINSHWWLRRFGGTGAGVGPLAKVDLAEEIRKRKERAKKFGLPVPVFAAEVRIPFWHPRSARLVCTQCKLLYPQRPAPECMVCILVSEAVSGPGRASSACCAWVSMPYRVECWPKKSPSMRPHHRDFSEGHGLLCTGGVKETTASGAVWPAADARRAGEDGCRSKGGRGQGSR